MPKKKKASGQKIISNMGLFWKRGQVRWKGNRGIGKARLAGRRRSAKKKGEVDFWKQTGIYALYAEYDLIYVGQADVKKEFGGIEGLPTTMLYDRHGVLRTKVVGFEYTDNIESALKPLL